MRKVIVILVLFVLSVFASRSKDITKKLFPDKEEYTKFDTKLKAVAPQNLYENGKYNFGRYSRPINNPNLHPLTKIQKLVQKKEWHFVSISTPDALFGLAVSQLGYAANAFLYIYTNDFQDQRTVMRPLGYGTTFSAASNKGCSEWNDRISNLYIKLCNTDESTTVYVNGVLNEGTKVFIEGTIDTKSSSLALAYPIGPNRVAYAHKHAGLPVTGRYEINGVSTDFNDAVAIQDWTRSLPRRLTVWYWIAINFVSSNGKRIGLNLSHGVYPEDIELKNGKGRKVVGLENVLWVDGKMYLVDGELKVKGEPGLGYYKEGEEWGCNTRGGSVAIDLTYNGKGKTISELNVGILNGRLIHSFGLYSGSITVGGEKFELKDVKGILEDHWTLW